MGKRSRNEGTGPYWSNARQRWVVQLSPGPDGRRPLRTANTEAEALKLKRQMEAERSAGRDLSYATMQRRVAYPSRCYPRKACFRPV